MRLTRFYSLALLATTTDIFKKLNFEIGCIESWKAPNVVYILLRDTDRDKGAENSQDGAGRDVRVEMVMVTHSC